MFAVGILCGMSNSLFSVFMFVVVCRVIKHASIGVCVFVVLCGVFKHVFLSVFVCLLSCVGFLNTFVIVFCMSIDGVFKHFFI